MAKFDTEDELCATGAAVLEVLAKYRITLEDLLREDSCGYLLRLCFLWVRVMSVTDSNEGP